MMVMNSEDSDNDHVAVGLAVYIAVLVYSLSGSLENSNEWVFSAPFDNPLL